MAIESLEGIEISVDVDTAGAVASTKTIDTQTKKIEKSFKNLGTQVTKTSQSVKAGLSGIGRSAGQAGIQLQQFVGQVQGGQSALLALSQQGADLGFVLGAPLLGAVVGIAASMTGLLIPALLGTSAEVKDLDDTLPRLIDKFNKLSESQQKFTREALNVKLGEQRKQYKALQIEINELQSAYQTARTGGDSLLARLLGESEEDLFKSLTRARTSLADVGLEIEKTQKTISKLGDNKKLTEATKNIINGLESQIIALKEGEEASFRFSAAQQLGLKVGEKIPANIDRQITSLFELKRAQEESKQAEIDKAKAQRESEAALKAYNDETFRQMQAEERAAQSKRKSTESSALRVADQRGDPIAALQAQKDKELEVLRAAEEQGLQLHTDYATLRSNIDEQYNERLRQIRLQQFAEESKVNELALNSIDALGAATTNTLSGLLSGTYSATEAMQQFANTVLNSAVEALVDVGAQYLKNAAIAQAADKAMLASETTTKAAKAAAHTAAVSATVAELSSLAGAGAFAATAAIPLVGPSLAPAAAGSAIAATAALGAPAISAAPIAGARYEGGPVSAGSLYEVGEKNKPELFISGGKQYMIPGNNGNVVSNKDMQNSGVNVNVVVNNLPGQTATVTGNGVTEQMVIQIADDRIKAQSASIGSDMNRNMNRNHNITSRLDGNRRN